MMRSPRFWPLNSRIRLASIQTCIVATLPHVFYLLDLHGTQPRVRHPCSRGDSSDCDWMRLRFPTNRRFRSDPRRGRIRHVASHATRRLDTRCRSRSHELQVSGPRPPDRLSTPKVYPHGDFKVPSRSSARPGVVAANQRLRLRPPHRD